LPAGGLIQIHQINDDSRIGRNLPVHAHADVLHPVPAHADVALRRGHHGVGKVDDDACRIFQSRHLGRQCALRLELDPQSIVAVGDPERLQTSARRHPLARRVSRGGDQYERHQRNQETQQLLSHFPISPCEALSPPCVSWNVFPRTSLPRTHSFELLPCSCLQAYTAGAVIFFTTSRVNVLPSRSCTVSWNTTESPVIFTT